MKSLDAEGNAAKIKIFSKNFSAFIVVKGWGWSPPTIDLEAADFFLFAFKAIEYVFTSLLHLEICHQLMGTIKLFHRLIEGSVVKQRQKPHCGVIQIKKVVSYGEECLSKNADVKSSNYVIDSSNTSSISIV